MVKIESLDPDIREIFHLQFNFPCCTCYYPKKYHNRLDILIHKDPEYQRPHRLRPILLFDIEANLHNKHLGRHSTKTPKETEELAPEQYGRQGLKAAEIQALNISIFYYIILLKRTPETRIFA